MRGHHQAPQQGDRVKEHQEAPDQVRIRIIFVIAYDEAERKKTKLSITETKMSVVGDPGKSIDNGHSEGGYAKVISESLKTSLMTSSDSVLMNYKWTRKQNHTCPKR
mgnify:CR=1 FL=1